MAVLKKVLAARLENKSARNEGHASCLRRSLRFSDTAGNGTLNHAQWLSVRRARPARVLRSARARAEWDS